jgi:hypothetical protein
MKTNVIMKSKDRFLLGVLIKQETKTGFLCLSDLQVSYDENKHKYGWSEKLIKDVLGYKDNLERIYYILEKQDFIKVSLNAFIDMVDNQGITTVLKKLGVYVTKGARKSKAVWCNPYIWVLIAMEMNPKLYAECVMWLTDKLILNRIEAGDMYRGLSVSISKWNPDYAMVAKGLNWCVFGKHESNIRNFATENQLKELRDLESNMSFAIDNGLIKSFPQLMNTLRFQYKRKHENIFLK